MANDNTPALEIKDLHAWYGESHILHGVDLTVNRGEVVTLLGRNGAGRTTTMRALSRRDLGIDEVRSRVSEGFARSFGVTAERITDPDAVRPALDAAMTRRGPTLLDVIVDGTV